MRAPLITQKEQELEDLTNEHKQCLKILNRQKSILNRLKEKILTMQKDTSNKLFNRMSKFDDLKKELLELLKEGQKSKFVSKSDKKEMKDLLHEIEGEDLFGIPNNFTENPNMEEDFYNKPPHEVLFDPFKVEINEQEKQNIRKVFIKLATQFHPDKAVNSFESEKFHSIMQRINLAYKRGDIAELIEIDANYCLNNNLTFHEDERGILEFMEQDIERIKHEIYLLNQQLVRTKKEINEINKSEMGCMLKDLSKQKKEGINPIGEMEEQLDFAYEELLCMKEGIEQLIKTGEWSKAMLDKHEMRTTDEESIEDFLDSFIVEITNSKRKKPKKKIRNTRRPKATRP